MRDSFIRVRESFIWVRDVFMCAGEDYICVVRDSLIRVRDAFTWVRDAFIWERDSSIPVCELFESKSWQCLRNACIRTFVHYERIMNSWIKEICALRTRVRDACTFVGDAFKYLDRDLFVCCSVLQCVAVCCSVLQCVAADSHMIRTHSLVMHSDIQVVICSRVESAIIALL